MAEIDPLSQALGSLSSRVDALESDVAQIKTILPKVDRIDSSLQSLMQGIAQQQQSHDATVQAVAQKLWVVASSVLLFVAQDVLSGGLLPHEYQGVANMTIGAAAAALVVKLLPRKDTPAQ